MIIFILVTPLPILVTLLPKSFGNVSARPQKKSYNLQVGPKKQTASNITLLHIYPDCQQTKGKLIEETYKEACFLSVRYSSCSAQLFCRDLQDVIIVTYLSIMLSLKVFWVGRRDALPSIAHYQLCAASLRFIIFSAVMKALCPSRVRLFLLVALKKRTITWLPITFFWWNRERHFCGLKMMTSCRMRARITDIWQPRGEEKLNGINLSVRYCPSITLNSSYTVVNWQLSHTAIVII